MRNILWASIGLASVMFHTTAHAHGSRCGDTYVAHPHAPATLPGAQVAAVYFKAIRNDGDRPEQLVGAETPVADKVQLHQMALEGDVMRMRGVPEVTVAPQQQVIMAAGKGSGHHLMLVGLRQPLQVGDRFPLTLRLSLAGLCLTEVVVEDLATVHAH
jgi:periplasmic copper chaperone A